MHSLSWLMHLYRYLCIRCISSIDGPLCIAYPDWCIFIDIYALDAFRSIDGPLCIIYPNWYIFIDIYALDAFRSIDGPLCIIYPNWCIFIDTLCIRCISIHWWAFMHSLSWLMHLYRYLCIRCISSIDGPLCITYPDWCIFIDIYVLDAFPSIDGPLCISECSTLLHYPDYLLIRASLVL